MIDLVEVDSDVAAAIPPEDRALAERVLTVPRLDAVTGPLEVPARNRWHGPVMALLLVRGAVARHVDVADRVATQFHGPGDLVQPWAVDGEGVPCRTRWSVHEAATFAVLDRRYSLAMSRWPELATLLSDRLAEQAARASVHTAIAQLPRVEQRVLAILWQLAERFGRVGPGGVVVPLRLTHVMIGECVGARRPTVTLALGALCDEGLLSRAPDGAWVLAPRSRAVLEGALGVDETPATLVA